MISGIGSNPDGSSLPSRSPRGRCRGGTFFPVRGFTLIEVLVAAVILFAGVGAVLKAYSSAVSALASASDLLNSTMLLREKAVELELLAASGAESFPGGDGLSIMDSVAYAWNIRCYRQTLSPDVFIQNASIRVSRGGGTLPRVLDCEWMIIREPRQPKGGAP